MSEKTINLHAVREVRVPSVPNYILSADGKDKWPISDFSIDEINALIEAWGDELERKAKKDTTE
jgi:hypothetical protein